jgi:hypothetical protein
MGKESASGNKNRQWVVAHVQFGVLYSEFEVPGRKE